MKPIFFTLTILATMLLTGCGYSFKKPDKNIEPIKNSQELHDVCVYKVADGLFTYDKAENLIAAKLDELSISYRITTKDNLENCPYTLSHSVIRSLSIPIYLQRMEVYVSDSQRRPLGEIQYDYYIGSSAMSSESLKNDDAKIIEFLNILFGKESGS